MLKDNVKPTKNINNLEGEKIYSLIRLEDFVAFIILLFG